MNAKNSYNSIYGTHLSTGVIESFLSSRVSPLTRRAYESDLKAIAPDDMDAIFSGRGRSVETMLRLKTQWFDSGLTGSTVRRRLGGLQSMLSYAAATEQITWSPAKIPLPKQDAPFPTPDEYGGVKGLGLLIDRMKREATGGTPQDKRDFAIITLMALHGLRRAEVMSIRRSDVERGEQTMIYFHGKGKVRRERLTLCATAGDALRLYIKARGEGGDPFVFVNRYGRRLSLRAVNKMVTARGATVGFPHLRPHLLRHAAIFVAGKTRAVSDVIRMSRHTSLSGLLPYMDADNNAALDVSHAIEKTLGL